MSKKWLDADAPPNALIATPRPFLLDGASGQITLFNTICCSPER